MSKQRSSGQNKRRRVASAENASRKALPSSHWAYAVAMLTEQVKAAEQAIKAPLAELPSEASEMDLIRVRALSSQI